VVKGQLGDHGYHVFLLLYRVVISWFSFDEEFFGVEEPFKNSNKHRPLHDVSRMLKEILG
jgi:hypothetical protein